MTIRTSMECYASRLASFSAAHPGSRSTKALKWPYRSPSPSELARAGFFYRPTPSSPDNTECYLCQSNLNGWEENDDAVVEHLKFSPDCGWAITIAIEQDIENGSYSLEDPMSEKVLNARRMTFGSNWPHENKRGWTCKVQKMIEAGWHYCPTAESDDFVKCSYCNLSLDGWEPKDKPFDEHQRRSPDCSFFTLYASMKTKPGRPKKSRTSKASRVSTQSNFAAVSEGASAVEKDANPDETTMSAMEIVKPTKTGRGAKKTAKARNSTTQAKGKGMRAKQDESQLASSFLEPEDDNFEIKVAPSHAPATGSKKRKSEELSTLDGDYNTVATIVEDSEPQIPTKKLRCTRADSTAKTREPPVPALQDEVEVDARMTDLEEMPPPSVPVLKRKGKGTKKRSSATARKTSNASTASKASLRATVPDDQDIEAALEADLNRPLTDEEGDAEPIEVEQPKSRRLTRTKPGSRKAIASVAPTRRGTRASSVIVDEPPSMNSHQPPQDAPDSHLKSGGAKAHDDEKCEDLSPIFSKEKRPKSKNLGKAGQQQHDEQEDLRGPVETHSLRHDADTRESTQTTKPQPARSRQTSRQLPTRNTRASNLPVTQDVAEFESDVNSSMLDSQTTQDDSGHETDAGVANQGRPKRGSKNVVGAAKKLRGKKGPLNSRNIEDVVQAPTSDVKIDEKTKVTPAVASDNADVAEAAVVEREPLKAQGKIMKPSKDKGNSPSTRTTARKASPAPSPKESDVIELQNTPVTPLSAPPPTAPALEHSNIIEPQDAPASPLLESPPAHSTPRPALSPQSSDAENQPPSSRPTTLRPPLSTQSPSKLQMIRVPLAASTPTASQPNGKSSRLQSTFPWTAVDLEHIFHGTPSANKENDPFVTSDGHEGAKSELTSPEKKLSVEQWIQFNAQRGEERLRNECERLVGKFEGEGLRALRTLEGITCAE